MVLTDGACRWLLIGTYVGFATVGAFVAWYTSTTFLGIDLSQDGHSTVTWHQLTHWNQCQQWKGFEVGCSCPVLFARIQQVHAASMYK